MSRAFVKEDEEVREVGLTRLESQHPNYVTPEGLRRLRERLSEAEASGAERDIAYLRRRIENAIVVDPATQPWDVVAFGATVTVEEPGDRQRVFTIVGEDQADPTHGTISWISPLAAALLGHRVGDRVLWKRPAGDLPLTIRAIEYRT